MKISQKGIEHIKQVEGLKLTKYVCSAGKNTIGIGHVIQPNENYTTITVEKAEELFKHDIENVENWLNKNASWCSQHEFDALCSFLFQYGTTLLARGFINTHNAIVQGNKAEVLRFLENDFNHAVAKNKDGLLKSRRQKEIRLFKGE
ncbi:MAG: lysozyme [Neisseriaceae bacterium]|nr:MAG: lysozyme [Neisseriaceae bacterium]